MWSDLMELKIVPVIEDSELGEVLNRSRKWVSRRSGARNVLAISAAIGIPSSKELKSRFARCPPSGRRRARSHASRAKVECAMIGRFIDQLRQRFHDLVLRVVDIIADRR
jgi:hypothetical protein